MSSLFRTPDSSGTSWECMQVIIKWDATLNLDVIKFKKATYRFDDSYNSCVFHFYKSVLLYTAFFFVDFVRQIFLTSLKIRL